MPLGCACCSAAKTRLTAASRSGTCSAFTLERIINAFIGNYLSRLPLVLIGGFSAYQFWVPATCFVVALRRLKRLVVAIMRITLASSFSS